MAVLKLQFIYMTKTNSPGRHERLFGNNILHTKFWHVELYLVGKLISHSNNFYLHSDFIQTYLTMTR